MKQKCLNTKIQIDVDRLKNKLNGYRTSLKFIYQKIKSRIREFIKRTEDRVEHIVEFIPYLKNILKNKYTILVVMELNITIVI